MEQYYFLFSLAVIWILFASIQDLKRTEVSNWLTFSLIAFAFVYRAIYSSISGEAIFFLFGFAGFALFFLLAHIFYYTNVFGGGDAKLLMGIGIVLPFESWKSLLLITTEFIFLLFFIGALYGLVYSIFKVSKNKEKFRKRFKIEFKSYRLILIFPIMLSILILAILKLKFGIIFSIILFSLFLLLIYLKAFENSCLMVLKNSDELIEGDWIEKDIKIGEITIKKTVHGLNNKDISLLKKYNKKIIIKQGIPFVPAFLLSFLIMVFFFLFSQFQVEQLISLFSMF